MRFGRWIRWSSVAAVVCGAGLWSACPVASGDEGPDVFSSPPSWDLAMGEKPKAADGFGKSRKAKTKAQKRKEEKARKQKELKAKKYKSRKEHGGKEHGGSSYGKSKKSKQKPKKRERRLIKRKRLAPRGGVRKKREGSGY